VSSGAFSSFSCISFSSTTNFFRGQAVMLKELDGTLGLEPIEGGTLPKARSKKARLREKKRKEQEEKGAVALQNVARMRTAKLDVKAKRQQREDAEQAQAAGTLGRVMRGKMGRKKFNEKKEGESVTLIQGRFRMLQSKKKVDVLKHDRKLSELESGVGDEDEDEEEEEGEPQVAGA
jgi:hypothetical protein